MRVVRTTPQFRADVARLKRRDGRVDLLKAFIDHCVAGTLSGAPYEDHPFEEATGTTRLCRISGLGHVLYDATADEVILIRLLLPQEPRWSLGRRPDKHRRPGWQTTSFNLAPAMLQHYVTTALRSLRKHKGYALINIFGLAVGMACCLLIFLFVRQELSYDRFHAKADRLYRLVGDVTIPGGSFRGGQTSAMYAPLFAEALPEIEAWTRFTRGRRISWIFEHEGQSYEETNLFFADSTTFDLFSFPLLRGNPETALAAPFSLLITESMARKYFGEEDPMGQTIRANGEHTFTITGLLEDIPATSHLRFDGLISMATAYPLRAGNFEDFLDLAFGSYVLLHEGINPTTVEAKFSSALDATVGGILRNNNITYTFALEPLTEVHLYSERGGYGADGNPETLYTFSAIALFILLIACINFTNLATARSTERAKEVGVRKVVGAARSQLAWQFLGESVLFSVGALGGALLLAALLLPSFNALADTSLSLAPLWQPLTLLGLLGGVVMVGLLAGSYPALVLSGFQPILVLKGRFFSSTRGSVLRKGLVVFQFAISVVLLAGTGLVYQQLRYLQRQNLGFRTEQMLTLHFRQDQQVRRQLGSIKRALTDLPGVLAATTSSNVPGTRHIRTLVRAEQDGGTTLEADLNINTVDFDFMDEYGIDLVAGRPFSPNFATDSTDATIINEAALEHLGYATPEAALGKTLHQWGRPRTIIGVMKDFHFASLRSEIEQLNFIFGPDLGAQYLTLRVAAADLPGTLGDIEQIWRRLVPHRPFDYRFLDDAFNAQYQAEERLGSIFASFALLAILIACLGVFGLANFMVQQRTKEIGVRKVLGASVPQIVLLLSRSFAGLVTIGFLVAVPVAYLIMDAWLSDFAYRTPIGPGLFLLAGLLALGIALLTVSTQSIKAATADPVQSLRYE